MDRLVPPAQLRDDDEVHGALRAHRLPAHGAAAHRSAALDAVDALIAYVTGVGADIHSYEATLSEVAGTADADEIRSVARQWAELDAERLPFMRSVAAEFESHDNRTQFRAGVDLILAGIERQAEAGV